MRVIGIDPGTRHLGWGVLDQVGTRISHVAHGVLDLDGEQILAGRLVEIDKALVEILNTFKPQVGAVESLFFSKDPQSAAKLGHARGVILLRLAHTGIPILEYAPARVKRSVVGRGAGDKKQVAMIVSAMLRLAKVPRADAADALAVALTHLQSATFTAALNVRRIL